MAHYETSQSYSTSERVLTRLGHLLERAAARLAHYRIYRNTLDELRALSDRDLNDLGFSRYMLKDVALETADKKVPLH